MSILLSAVFRVDSRLLDSDIALNRVDNAVFFVVISAAHHAFEHAEVHVTLEPIANFLRWKLFERIRYRIRRF